MANTESVDFYFQRFDVIGHSIHQWLDNSPYVFQNWHQPSPQNIYRDYQAKELKYFNLNNIHPPYDETGLCTAVFETPTLSAQWIAIPCQQPLPGGVLICESKKTVVQFNIKTNLFRAKRECRRKTINFQSSCLRVINYVHQHKHKAEEICYMQGMSVFQLPHFLIYLDPKVGWLSWNEDNFFSLKFLMSISHRWPSIYDRSAEKIDIILGGDQQSPEKMNILGIQYSNASLAHVRVDNMQNKFSPGDLYILLCHDPMLISNSLCLHGHDMCYDGTCILSHYVCDGRVDCPDASDEIDCNDACSFSINYNLSINCFLSCTGPECLCKDLYFSCALGGCLPWSRVCDGVLDCPHGEDEQQCYFNDMSNATRALFVANNFQDKLPLTLREDYKCRNGSTISRVLVNDLIPDCSEQDDEEQYYAFLKNGSRADFFTESVLCEESDATTCAKNYRGVCYPRYLHCIHEAASLLRSAMPPIQSTQTCRNGAHLNSCKLYACPSFFKCPSAYCIPVYAVCNGIIDCPNGEDENSCQKMSCPGFLLCRDDKLCVHPNDVWSGKVKCPISMDDKAFQDADACPAHCECHGNGIMCKSLINLQLPVLQAALRVLIINNTQINLDDIEWKADLIALLYLKLTFAYISSVKTKHFARFHFLQTLCLRNNIIPSLPAGVFLSLAKVKEIDLGHNLIHYLHSGIFNGVSMLRLLKLDSNKLTFVAPCTFDELDSLSVLDLSNNYLTNIGDNVFCNHKSYLKQLYIGANRFDFINNGIVLSHMQYLKHLNTTPLQICCFVPMVEYCFPKDKFYLSTCRNLLGLMFRYGTMISGILLLFISICCTCWISQRIKYALRDKTHSGNKSLNNILNLFLFVCHGLNGIHMITLACVDIVLHDQYALYEQKWRRHPLCMLLNMFSYILMLVSIFVFLLVTYLRMIACVYSFKLGSISASRPIWAIIIFLLFSFGVCYIPYSGIGGAHIDEPQMALGFGLILPIRMHDQYWWSLLGYVTPVAVMLCVSSTFQVACIRVLSRRSKTLNQCSKALSSRRRSVVMCIATLILPLCCQLPLLLLHVASIFGVEYSPYITLAATVATLNVYSVASAILYVIITPEFIAYIT